VVHWQFVAGWLTVWCGYTMTNLFLQYFYYKVPLLSTKSEAPDHHRRVFTNLAIASTFAGGLAELCVRDHSRLLFGPIYNSFDNVAVIVGWTLVASIYEGVLEYYWHRTMHLPFFYRHVHKIHHFHKKPLPFDDLYVHHLEVTGYYCILWSPALVFRMPYYSFVLYMIYMGLTGILDHSNMPLEVPGFYNTMDHAAHHAKFEVNYGFPHPFMDLLHGTFDGTFLGFRIRARGTVARTVSNNLAKT